MSAYYIALDEAGGGIDTWSDGTSVFHEIDDIDGIAKRLGIKTPYEYFSVSREDALSMLQDGGQDAAGIAAPDEVFYSAQDGLEWMGAIRN